MEIEVQEGRKVSDERKPSNLVRLKEDLRDLSKRGDTASVMPSNDTISEGGVKFIAATTDNRSPVGDQTLYGQISKADGG